MFQYTVLFLRTLRYLYYCPKVSCKLIIDGGEVSLFQEPPMLKLEEFKKTIKKKAWGFYVDFACLC